MARPDPSGSSPAGGDSSGRVEMADIRSKLREIRGELDERTEVARSYGLYAVAGGLLAVAVLAFLLGRRRGRAKRTWVEVRRQ